MGRSGVFGGSWALLAFVDGDVADATLFFVIVAFSVVAVRVTFVVDFVTVVDAVAYDFIIVIVIAIAGISQAQAIVVCF